MRGPSLGELRALLNAEGEGQPCGDSYISSDKECRLGEQFSGKNFAEPPPVKVPSAFLKDPEAAMKAFRATLRKQYPIGFYAFHESPLANAEDIRKNGIRGGESGEAVFATVGKPSGFVSSDKVVVKFMVRPNDYWNLAPDMRYNQNNPAADLLRQHKGVHGADIAYDGDVLPGDIHEMWIVRAKKQQNRLFNAVVGDLMPFSEALQALRGKGVLPTNLSSADLMGLDAALRERAFFSARTLNATYLQRVKGLIDRVLEPYTGEREGKPVTKGMGYAEARTLMKDELEKLGYEPDKPGTIEDLSSDQRLNLIVETQAKMARGFGFWKQATGDVEVEAYPCFEFYRGGQRKEPRDWPSRWAEAGGEFYQGGKREPDYPEGRMIARKDDPIWVEISAFGLPYPPFDFNSGMDLRPISWAEAVDLGVIEEDEEAKVPDDRPFEGDAETSVEDLDPDLLGQLISDLGGAYQVVKGVLSLVNRLQNAEGQGEPCGDSWISPDKECRIGTGGVSEPKIEPQKAEEPSRDQLDRASKVFQEFHGEGEFAVAVDRQMRGGVIKKNGEFVDFTPAQKQTNLNKIARGLDAIKSKDPEAFELARQWDLADRLGVKEYKQLPETITVYRGSAEEEFGKGITNVSHMRKIAENFGSNGVVTEYEIPKTKIKFSLANSVFDEGELIVSRADMKVKSVSVSDHVKISRRIAAIPIGQKVKFKSGETGTLKAHGIGNSMVVERDNGNWDYGVQAGDIIL